MNGHRLSFTFYEPIHFSAKELVPESVYSSMGDACLRLFDCRMLYTIDCLREFFDCPLTINDWAWGGNNHYRGFRPQGCGIGAALSMHKFGKGLDVVSKKYTGEEMRNKIMEVNRLFPYITRMEKGTPHLHIDNANIKHDGIYLFAA